MTPLYVKFQSRDWLAGVFVRREVSTEWKCQGIDLLTLLREAI